MLGSGALSTMRRLMPSRVSHRPNIELQRTPAGWQFAAVVIQDGDDPLCPDWYRGQRRVRRVRSAIEEMEHTSMRPKNTICLWFDKDAHEAARFYAVTFPDSKVTAVHKDLATTRAARRAMC